MQDKKNNFATSYDRAADFLFGLSATLLLSSNLGYATLFGRVWEKARIRTRVHFVDGVVESLDSDRAHALRHDGDRLEASLPDSPLGVEEERPHQLD